MPANPAQIMIECLASLPYPLGKTRVAQVLAGSGAAKIEPDQCRHFGALAMCTQEAISAGLQTLLDTGWLHKLAIEKRSTRFYSGDHPPQVLALTSLAC